jgi:ADP-heptose:LPS heptosyltransferase/tetratricopeptide (TPR) repeat protein/glycosyltransferase involved in cell wall biosynthesis
MKDPEKLRLENDVAVADDGELFLASSSRRTLDYAFGRIKPAEKYIEIFRDNIERRKAFCSSMGASYRHFVAPDKHRVYRESFFSNADFSFAEHFVAQSGVDIVYPAEYLRSFLPERVYKRTDTHWSPLGIALICVLVARELGLSEASVEAGKRDILSSLTPMQRRISGDLGSKVSPPEYEFVPVVEPNWRQDRFNNGLTTGNDGILEVVLSGHPNSHGRLVIFGDSYFRECLDFLGVYFREILFCRTRYFHEEAVRAARPDYVITENAERYLGLVAPDADAPPIFMMAPLLGREPRFSVEASAVFSHFLNPTSSVFANLVQKRIGWSRSAGFSREVPSAASAVEVAPTVSDLASRMRTAWSFVREKKAAHALEALGTIDHADQGSADIHWLLGNIYRLEGRDDAAEEEFKRGLVLDIGRAELRRALADTYLRRGQIEAAAEQLRALAVGGDPADLQKFGQVLLRLSRPEEAVPVLQQCVTREPTATRHRLLGSALLRLSRNDEAYASYQQALAVEPDRPESLSECGQVLLRLKRPHDALRTFERLTEVAPSEKRAYLGAGRAQIALGEPAAAAQIFERGLAACGEDLEMLLELARLRARGGDRVAAMEVLGRILAAKPDHLAAALEYIRQAMTARKFGPAKEVADKLIAQHPEHPEVLFEFGRVCLETAQPERARESFEAALRHRPEMHQAHYRLSQISLRANDIPAAVEQMSRAVDLDPTRVSYRIDRARMYLALGQFDAAQADAEAALAIEPRNLKANQIVSLVREMSDERPEARVAACFHATAAELPALQAALAMLPAPHEAWTVVSEGAAPDAGERVLRLGRDAVEPTLTEASEAPWMLVAPAAAAPAIVALLADPSTEAALRPLEKIYGRAVFIDAAGLPAMTVMRRELLHFFGDMAEIEGRPAHALLAEHEEMLRTVTIDPAGVVHRLQAPTLPREDGREKVFLISRHGYQLYGGGEQFLRGMATIYRGEGFEPVIIGMRSDTPAAVEGEEEGQRFAQLRPLPGDIFTYALKHRPRLVQVLSGLGYEVITPLKYLHVATVYGTHFWRDMFEEIGGYLNIDQTAVPKREFNAILQQATVVYSNSHYTAEMKRKHFGVSTPLVYSLTADTDAPPVTTGKYALLVNARPEKGFDLILEVAKRVPHVPFLVLASQSPVAQAQEAVERAGVKNITIAGKVSDMMEAYSRAKVVLVPSYAFIETFSRVVIEAHRLGVPVIGSDRGNVPYLMTESGTSLPEDADAWAAELDRLFTDRAYYDQRVKLALENSERYAFARQPERIRRIVGFTERRILVAVGAGLGNIVQTSPLIRRLAEHYGRPVDVVVKEDFKGCSVLVAGSPYVNMVFPLDRNVVQREYDMVYVTHSFGDIIPAFNSNTIVAARRHFVFQMTKDIHEAEFNLFCARELLGVPYEKADAAKYFVANASRSRLPNGIIGIHSGGKGGEWEAGSWLNKRWPYYKDLVKALQARGYKVASFGVQSEYVEGTIDLTGTPLMESVRNIAQCSYFIGNDSGLMHIADGLGVPLTTIFGPTSVVKNGPLAPTSSVIELKKDCAPCQFDERFATCTCIASVGLEPVLDHVLRHMAKAAGPEGEKAYKGLETLPVLVG